MVDLGELVVEHDVVGVQQPKDREQRLRRGIEELLLVEVSGDEGGVK